MELIMNFNDIIDYHPRRANIVKLKKVDAKIDIGPEGSLVAQLKVWSIFQDKVQEVQQRDVEVDKVRNKVKSGVEMPF